MQNLTHEKASEAVVAVNTILQACEFSGWCVLRDGRIEIGNQRGDVLISFPTFLGDTEEERKSSVRKALTGAADAITEFAFKKTEGQK